MTKLTKPVTRRTALRVSRRDVVLTIAPAGSKPDALLGMRLAGTRTQYVIALADVFRWAAETHAAREAAAKKAARKAGIPWRKAKRDFVRAFDLGGVR